MFSPDFCPHEHQKPHRRRSGCEARTRLWGMPRGWGCRVGSDQRSVMLRWSA
jgi:hypothetical protein